jgi:hypothetical protein
MSIDIPLSVFHNPPHQAGNTRHHDEMLSFGIQICPSGDIAGHDEFIIGDLTI